ncbi:hypothetical protein BOX15_Mlig024592g1, partial [Macrostomum lignano]
QRNLRKAMSDSTTNATSSSSSSMSQPISGSIPETPVSSGPSFGPAAAAASVDWTTQWANLLKQEEQLQPDGRFGFEQIGRLLSAMRAKLSQYAWRSVAKPRARNYSDPTTGRSLVRFYYLVANNFLGQTLWYVDVDPDYCSDPATNRHKQLVNLLTIKSQLLSSSGNRGLSREEELLQERKRSFSTGIVDYDLDPNSGTIVFAYQNFVCHLVDNPSVSNSAEDVQPKGIEAPHTPLNLALCPSDPRIAAYAAERTVYCICFDSKQILAAYTLPAETKTISAGLPPFAVQEEFDRFHGFWWRPVGDEANPTSQDLIIEVVDESSVESIKIVDPLKGGLETDSFSYPRAGTPNAVSSLVNVSVSRCADAGTLVCTNRPVDQLQLDEYLVRIDWTQSGEALLAQSMNRRQDLLRLLAYYPDSGFSICLLEESAPSDRWIEVHELIQPLLVTDRRFELIWASEETGYRHLYHVTCCWLPGDSQAKVVRRQLTFGDWQVQPDHLSVDVANGWLYFNSTRVDPRCVQLCRVNYLANHESSSRIEILTTAHNVFNSSSSSSNSSGLPKTCSGLAFPEQGVALLTVHCSQHSPEARLCSLKTANLPAISLLTKAIGCDNFFLQPEYFQFTGPGGQTLYGLLFKPFNCVPGRQYPTLQYIYGGPHVQLVTNAFVGFSFHRVTKACYFGFCVLIVDNRGSENRGRDFAAEIRHKMGSLELPDQVAGLEFAAKKFGCIDLNRVGLFGWSYGGYLTLIGMRDFNNIYRLGVAGAPVTEWELYDTAYTERYMGLPDGPGGCYEASSVIGANKASGFPGDANRLLVVHGSIDENVHYYHTAKLLDKLVLAKKPYNLLIYPSERHGLRNAPSKDHFETCLMHFLCQHL